MSPRPSAVDVEAAPERVNSGVLSIRDLVVFLKAYFMVECNLIFISDITGFVYICLVRDSFRVLGFRVSDVSLASD